MKREPMNRANLINRCGRLLGIAGAGAVQVAGTLTFMLGWLIVSLFVGLILTSLFMRWPPLSWFEAKGFGLGLALLAAGAETVGLRRLIRQFGLALGYRAAGFLAFLATAPWANGDLLATRAIVTGALASLSLSVVTGFRHPDQVARIIRRARAYMNGVRKDGSAWDFFGCVGQPGVPAAGLGFALYSLFNPAVAAQAVSWTFAQYEAAELKEEIGHPVAPHLLPAPDWVSSAWLWLALAGLFAIAFYVGCRRIGSGSVARGLRLWFLSLGEAGGAIGVLWSILAAVGATDTATRIVCGVLALVLIAAAFGARHRRVFIINRYGHHDPMFNR
jgi:hypothetical protein